MYKALRYLLPVAFVVVGVSVFWWLIATRPEPSRTVFRAPPPSVEVQELKKQNYQVVLRSQGTVRARTESVLAAEVRGRILTISASFREGGFFEEGDLLVQIDDSDYKTEVVSAESALVQAELRLYEERERFEQAKLDWDRLNPGQKASSLALREPQLRQAEASLASAEARVETAKRDLERTQLRAPYAGRILSKSVDVGQYVTPGTVLARVFAVDFAEVRLPLSENQLGFLDLPEVYRGDSPDAANGPPVILTGKVGGEEYEWRGRVVRAEGSVDVRTRQLSVVAQIPNPYGRSGTDRPPLKVGSFVQAAIIGTVLSDVFVVPRKLLRENQFLLLVSDDGTLDRREVEPVWSSDGEIVVRDGLKAGERLCTTLVPYAVDGMQVSVVGAQEGGAEVAGRMPGGGPAAGGAGGGGFAQRILAAIPPEKPLPDHLKAKLQAASGDMQATRAAMQEVRAWAEAQGIQLPGPPGR